MSVPLWVIETAERFWEDAGEQETYPRALRGPIARALPLAVISLPRLRVSCIDAWLERMGISCAMGTRDRALRACLVARFGQGLLFLDGADPEDEIRFSLAHELAHFLRHYQQRRSRAGAVLGPEILEVLDGLRPPSQPERAHALLAGQRVGYFVHLMERGADGETASETIEKAEIEADQLAYELLAPESELLPLAARFPADSQRARTAQLLHAHYGFPIAQARRYAARLAPRPTGADSFMRRLRLVP